MAIRNILKEGEPTLTAHCRTVEQFNERLHVLLDDMYETMIKADGVGLAAPQVGIRRRIVVIDVGDGKIEMINPVFTLQEGEQETIEGCLSFPGQYALTKRPQHVKVHAQDRTGKPFDLEASDFLATACCHEIDHLDGILFQSHAIRMLTSEELAKMR
jgi:peptide deformylase